MFHCFAPGTGPAPALQGKQREEDRVRPRAAPDVLRGSDADPLPTDRGEAAFSPSATRPPAAARPPARPLVPGARCLVPAARCLLPTADVLSAVAIPAGLRPLELRAYAAAVGRAGAGVCWRPDACHRCEQLLRSVRAMPAQDCEGRADGEPSAVPHRHGRELPRRHPRVLEAPQHHTDGGGCFTKQTHFS
eukprot:SAG22_NODE_972_length_6227_cov_16.910085_3_plen_191_part_00